MKHIIIIGTGWYGLHTYMFLKESNYDCKITILEKNNEIFDNSSNYNQNRLHLGYHYPRSFATRELCIKGYNKFISKYRHIIDFIDNNYYLISNQSFIDFNTYIEIYNNNDKYQHSFINNQEFKNIDGNIIVTKEKIIDSYKAKRYFQNKINNENIKFNYEVTKVIQNDDKIIINDELECDILINCTYNQLNLHNENDKYTFELTLSLIYDRLNFDECFESLTIMDGDFFSLFPREISKKKYTLTHVKYTPLIKSNNIDDIKNYILLDETLETRIKHMESDVSKIYPNFKKNFMYKSYFLSYKCKLNSKNDTRKCNIYENNNIISVNCGKITGIFDFEDYLIEKLNL